MLLDAVWDLVREFGGWSPFFGVEGEAAEVVETCRFDEFEQFIELVIRFAGEADNQGCSQDTTGEFCSELFDETDDFVFGVRATHRFEDLRIYVLKGYVEVVKNFLAGGDGFNQTVGDSGREEIKQANPAEAWDF